MLKRKIKSGKSRRSDRRKRTHQRRMHLPWQSMKFRFARIMECGDVFAIVLAYIAPEEWDRSITALRITSSVQNRACMEVLDGRKLNQLTCQWFVEQWKKNYGDITGLYYSMLCHDNKTDGHLIFGPVIDFLLEKKADVHHERDYPIRWASIQGYQDVVQILIDHKADVQAKDNDSLWWAFYKGHTNVVRTLIHHGADVNLDDNDLLCTASFSGDHALVGVLLAHKANVNAQNHYPICWSSAKGHQAVVQTLIQYQADVTARNNIPLQWASLDGHDSVVQILLEHKADARVLHPDMTSLDTRCTIY